MPVNVHAGSDCTLLEVGDGRQLLVLLWHGARRPQGPCAPEAHDTDRGCAATGLWLQASDRRHDRARRQRLMDLPRAASSAATATRRRRQGATRRPSMLAAAARS